MNNRRIPSIPVLAMYLFAFVVPFAFQIQVIVSPFDTFVLNGSYDDTFLYLQIARNWMRHGFPTFDGLVWTNGFQPLWQLVLVVLALITTESERLFEYTYFVALAFYIATLWPLQKCMQCMSAHYARDNLSTKFGSYFIAALWLLGLTLPKTISGMEDSLHCFIFAWMVYSALELWTSESEWRSSKLLLLGILFGLNGLTRLDSGIISVALAVPFAIRLLKQNRLRSVITFLSPPALLLGVYLLLNQIYFGTLTPTSGASKVFWASADPDNTYWILRKAISVALHESGDIFAVPHWVPAGIVFLFCGAMLFTRPRLRAAALYGTAIITVHSLFLYVVLRFLAASPWYYTAVRVSATLMVAFLFLEILSKCSRNGRELFSAVSAALLISISTYRVLDYFSVAEKSQTHWLSHRLRAAHWIHKNASQFQSELIGSWNAGTLGYFGDPATVINLDGLVQNPQFLKTVLKNSDWRRYFNCRGVSFLADYNEQDGAQTRLKDWDRTLEFRGVVPLDKATIITSFGPETEKKRIHIVDIRNWVRAGAPSHECEEFKIK